MAGPGGALKKLPVAGPSPDLGRCPDNRESKSLKLRFLILVVQSSHEGQPS